jgi:hypothetical protein
MHLLYLAKPTYGGWVTFTAHLALKHSLPLLKISKRTESRHRPFGYGVTYQNIAIDELPQGPLIISAIDRNFYDLLPHIPDNTYVVIHDPSEVTKKTSPLLLEHLKRLRIITIRQSVKDYLQDTYGLPSTFLLHPFFPYPLSDSDPKMGAVSVSRIDFDKHIDIILEANAGVKLYGSANGRYVHFKLDRTAYNAAYCGSFPKTFDSISDILRPARYVVDMSMIHKDGGGTQYSFLEAIYEGCILIIHTKWINGKPTPFKHMHNCIIVDSPRALAAAIACTEDLSHIPENAKEILAPHIAINWLEKLETPILGHSPSGSPGHL